MELIPANETWCIDDTLFYPLGLINHTTGTKSVFVTWCDKYLMNFIFKKITPTANRCNKFIINVPEEIQDIVILEVNTLVLLKNGEVCYFSSIKSIHRIPWLSTGVRCVSQSVEGFSLIRVLDDMRINLEVYKDEPNVGKMPQKPSRSFDITFDEANLFNCDWSDERFMLTSIGLTNTNRKFLEALVGEVGLQALEVHVFSISNSLFALYTSTGDEYEIKTLTPQVSSVEFLQFLREVNMLLIFLNCGIIEVWYTSNISTVIERYTYINGSKFVHHTFAGDILFFTDELRVCRLNFVYDAVEHTCRVVECSIDAPGMVAVTYEEASDNLVCLSHNNVFFHLSFSIDSESNGEMAENEQLFELNDEKIKEMLSECKHFNEINSLPGKVDKCIEEEYRKQELIAVCRKSTIYSELITANISFTQHIPVTKENLFYPGDCGIPAFTYFAVVTLKILSNEIFKSTAWNLMIAYTNQVRLMAITPELLVNSFSILIPIKRNRNELIPDITIQMLAHVNIDQDFVSINIPVKIEDIDVKKLFSTNQGLAMSIKESDTLFFFKIIVPDLHSSLFDNLFGHPCRFENDVEIHTQKLYFLGEKVTLTFTEPTKLLSVESASPVAVFYAKICIWECLWENCTPSSNDVDGLRNTLMEIQCQVEKRYGALTEKEMHLACLKRVYEKLRNEVIWTF